MSRSSKSVILERFQFPNSRQLWHDADNFTPSLGCNQCHYRERCGGLQTEAQVFDCTSLCRCTDPPKCDNVCSKNPGHFVARIQEVRTLALENVQRASRVSPLDLPSITPLVYHSAARSRTPAASVVALSLYELIDKRSGELRFKTRHALTTQFRISNDSMIVLSGTDQDLPLERWWRLKDRTATARALGDLGVKLITAPNFSLFDDVPRFDNMYNMKRIAISAAEIQSAGVHCAIHVNARTDRDWDHWISYLTERDEYDYIAFEFGTGAGARPRFPWHVKQLCRLAREVPRPINLIARGGIPGLQDLGKAFSTVTLIDTASFVRAQRRRRAVVSSTGLSWEQALTPKGAFIDDLLDENVAAMGTFVQSLIGPRSRPLVQLQRICATTHDGRDETLKSSRLAETSSH